MRQKFISKENDASAIESNFTNQNRSNKKKFKFGCNPLTGSQNIVITSYIYMYMYDHVTFDL